MKSQQIDVKWQVAQTSAEEATTLRTKKTNPTGSWKVSIRVLCWSFVFQRYVCHMLCVHMGSWLEGNPWIGDTYPQSAELKSTRSYGFSFNERSASQRQWSKNLTMLSAASEGWASPSKYWRPGIWFIAWTLLEKGVLFLSLDVSNCFVPCLQLHSNENPLRPLDFAGTVVTSQSPSAGWSMPVLHLRACR